MVTRTAREQEICPFTLEPCEHCCDRKADNGQGICPFTLEPCSLEGMDSIHRAWN